MKEKSNFNAKVKHFLAQNQLERFATDDICDKFYHLTEIMNEVGKNMNLTAIRDEDGIILKHYVDCLLAADEEILPKGAKIIDVGCGAGFPSFPFAIARPDLDILGIDSTAKKVNYVNITARELGLSNLRAESYRAEEQSGGPLRESFDIATARAVAALPVLCELCLPYVKVGGSFVALKGKTGDIELENAKNAIKMLGGEVSELLHLKLIGEAEDQNDRTIIIIKKIKPTPKDYPRKYSQIVKAPL